MSTSSNKQLALEAMNAYFDGRMNKSELAKLLVIAAEDGTTDDDERHLLTSIVCKLNGSATDQAAHNGMNESGRIRH